MDTLEQTMEINGLNSEVLSLKTIINGIKDEKLMEIEDIVKITRNDLNDNPTKILLNNFNHLIQRLPQHSQIRGALVSSICCGIEIEWISKLIGFEVKSTKRMMMNSKPEVLDITFMSHNKRKCIDNTKLRYFWMIIDELIPVQSGRKYRVLVYSYLVLYDRYKERLYELAPEQVSLGVTTVIYKLLKKINIHHSLSNKICNICNIIEKNDIGEEQLDEKEMKILYKNQTHQTIWQYQCNYYFFIKNLLIYDPKSILIIQDFSQLQMTVGYCQDLIITFYYSVDQELYHQFMNFTSTSTKNDSKYVIACWESMIKEGLLDDYDDLIIFSDGGPKHFKTSAIINYYSSLATRYHSKSIEYNLFASNHGCSACDGAAGQISKSIKATTGETNQPILTEFDINQLIGKLKNHESKRCPEITEDMTKEVPTFKKIRSFHKWKFCKDGKILAFEYDSCDTPPEIYQRKVDYYKICSLKSKKMKINDQFLSYTLVSCLIIIDPIKFNIIQI